MIEKIKQVLNERNISYKMVSADRAIWNGRERSLWDIAHKVIENNFRGV